MLQAYLREAAPRDLPRARVPLHRHRVPGRARLPQQEGHQQLLLASQLDWPRRYGTVWDTGDWVF